MEVFIVNLTTESYFRYYMENDKDAGYNKLLKELLTSPNKISNYSHWNKKDRIVFCPQHIHKFVETNFNELYL